MFVGFRLLPPLECNLNMKRDLILFIDCHRLYSPESRSGKRLACRMFIREQSWDQHQQREADEAEGEGKL